MLLSMVGAPSPESRGASLQMMQQMLRIAPEREGTVFHTPPKVNANFFTGFNRAFIEARVAREPGLRLLFLESFCNDPDVIAANIALKVSSGDPDYAHMSPKVAEADFRRRIQQYESAYQPIVEKHLSYMKIINVGAQTHMNHINGYLQSRIVYYLMNLHLKPRSIFFSRVSFFETHHIILIPDDCLGSMARATLMLKGR